MRVTFARTITYSCSLRCCSAVLSALPPANLTPPPELRLTCLAFHNGQPLGANAGGDDDDARSQLGLFGGFSIPRTHVNIKLMSHSEIADGMWLREMHTRLRITQNGSSPA